MNERDAGGNRQMLWGEAAQDAFKANKVPGESVIELWKLSMYDESGSPIVERLKKQLGRLGLTLPGLMAWHLRGIMAKTRAWVKTREHFDVADVDELRMKLFLSMPQLWGPDAVRMLTEAAAAAGIPHVETVYEAECSAAYFVHQIMANPSPEHAEGEELMMFDLGGGTGDLMLLRFASDARNGAQVLLKNVGSAGALCGSEFVNENFRTWVLDSWSKVTLDFAGTLKRLNLSEASFLKQAVDEFERHKRQFSGDMEGRLAILSIVGAGHARDQVQNIQLSPHHIASFFDPVLDNIVSTLNEQLKGTKVKTLLLPGGFGRSKYLLERLYREFDGRLKITTHRATMDGAYSPVVRGALCRYAGIKMRGLKDNEGFVIASVEPFDPADHPDADVDRKKVLKCPLTKGDIVYERCTNLLTKTGGRATKKVWQSQDLLKDDQALRVQIYTTRVAIPDHAPIRQGVDGNSPLREGVREWGEPLTIPRQTLRDHGFKKQVRAEGSTGGWCVRVYWQLSIEVDGANVEATWSLAKPDSMPKEEGGEWTFDDADIVRLDAFTLNKAAFNIFPRTDFA